MIFAITFCDVTIKMASLVWGVCTGGAGGAMESVAVYHEQRYVVGRILLVRVVKDTVINMDAFAYR